MLDREPRQVLVVSGSEKGSNYLASALPSPVFEVYGSVNGVAEAKRKLDTGDCDVVVVNTPLKDEFGADFAIRLAEEASYGVILIVKNEVYDPICYKAEGSGTIVLSKPLPGGALVQAVHIAAAVHDRLARAEKKTESILKRMEEIRIVNHAKWILISKLGMDEESAHRFIEKQAMDLRQTRTEVSQFLIRTYENQ